MMTHLMTPSPSGSGWPDLPVRLPATESTLPSADLASDLAADHEGRQCPVGPVDVVMHLVGEYVKAGGESSDWEADHLATALAAAAARDQWTAADWQLALDRLHHLARPGGVFLGGNRVLAHAIAVCRREVKS